MSRIADAVIKDRSGRLFDLQLTNLPPDHCKLFESKKWPSFLARVRSAKIHFDEYIKENSKGLYGWKFVGTLFCGWIRHLASVELLVVSIPATYVVGQNATQDINAWITEPLPKLHSLILFNFVVPQSFIALQRDTLQLIRLEDCALSCSHNVGEFQPDNGYWKDFFETLAQHPSTLRDFRFSPKGVWRYVRPAHFDSCDMYDCHDMIVSRDNGGEDSLAYDKLMDSLRTRPH